MKFYDLTPAGKDGHYLNLNGSPIARYNDLTKAEEARQRMMEIEAERLES